MKKVLMVLTFLLVISVWTIQISQVEATSFHLYELTHKDYDGTVIQVDYFAAGADLSNHFILEPPLREGYTFVGWTVIGEMPESDVIVIAQYMRTQVLVTNSI